MEQPPKIAILGAGSWGTALAILLAGKGFEIALWAHLRIEAEALLRDRENRAFLPGLPLPEGITPEYGLEPALEGAQDVILVVPSHAFGSVVQQIAPFMPRRSGLSWATKGFDPGGGRLLHEVAREYLGARPLAVISGPSFAREVARGLPTAVTVAANDPAFGQHLASCLHGPRFRAYTSDDLVGVQVGGAVKNVLAIATGLSDGLGFGANTRAALITRGIAEISRMGVALGGRAETFMGLAGLGDLVLTCTDDQSRNRRLGLALAGGLSIEEARARIGQEVEGVHTAAVVRRLALRHGIEMPISEQVFRVLFEGATPALATQTLLERASRAELW